MEMAQSPQFWAFVALIAAAAFLIGRAGRGRSAAAEKAAAEARAAERYAALPASRRLEIDLLIRSGQMIDAIKALREATGLGLGEARSVVDARKREIAEGGGGLA